MTRVVVATANWTRRPEFGGLTWVPLHYVLSLRDLGVEAWWIDHLKRVDPFKKDHTPEYLWKRLLDVARRHGLEDVVGIRYDGGARYFGCTAREVEALAEASDALIALGRVPPDGTPLMGASRRAYVDIDPGFTQIWALQRDTGLNRFHHHFTVGQNVGRPGFQAPADGLAWQSILPPVHLPSWPARIDEECRRYSTVADWRGDQVALLGGEMYGGKRSEFIRYLQVPLLAGRRIELALCIGQHDHEDLGLLTGHDWRVRNPYEYAGDPEAYREFIQYSRAEFAVGKQGYVKSGSGWFSDRTACYLASGKPALVQSTGFEGRLPTGEGLLTFRSVEEAVGGIQDIEERYLEHCRAARLFAERYLDGRSILRDMLLRMGVAAGEAQDWEAPELRSSTG